MLGYAITLFLSAFLLFQVQPLIGKYILPWFGGGPGVWTTCMLFFQVLLLGGYAYAHLTSRLLKARAQAILHGILLLAALAMLPITPEDSWKPRGAGDPVMEILLLLAASIGLPYFVLSSTGPLMQQWFSRANPGVSPYRLYALSNVGSLLALVTYPFVIENHFERVAQASLWAWGFAAFALCCGFCAVKLWQGDAADAAPPAGGPAAASAGGRSSLLSRVLWLLLPACASTLLLATTNKLCQDVAVMPFLWVLPLAIYLSSFILAFDSPRWYVRELFAVALVAGLAGVSWALFKGNNLSLGWQVVIYCGALFVCCMVCHGELYRLRPDPRRLTGFYLSISAGGALGGVFVAVVAPLVFSEFYEMHWALLLCAVLFTIVCVSDRASTSSVGWRWLAGALTLAMLLGVDALIAWAGREHPTSVEHAPVLRLLWWILTLQLVVMALARKQHLTFRHWRRLACCWLTLGSIALAAVLWREVRDVADEMVLQSRNFYGTLRVFEYNEEEPENHYFLLDHGHTTHGMQFVDARRARWPTSYYVAGSGVSKGIAALPEGPRRIGVVGLGTGTMAAFGRAGDYLRIYEINPAVERVANSHFTYLSDCPAEVEVALGDARLSMEHEPKQSFDLLALDAFNGDAVPVHLLTEEAFELYLRHLKPDGVIAVNISNRYVDLRPVVRNVAERFGFELVVVDFEEEDEEKFWIYGSTWALLTRNRALVSRPEIRDSSADPGTIGAVIPLWTDDFASLFQVLK